MNAKIYNVLFLCTGNSARSILAESIMNKLGEGRFKAYSAGSFPTGKVNPLAIKTLQQFNHDTTNLRSKSWAEFATLDAPFMDFIFTVCDQASGEVCPIWPGHPVTAHWGLNDPSHLEGNDTAKSSAFLKAYQTITQRIRLFLSLPFDKLDPLSLQSQLTDIGKS